MARSTRTLRLRFFDDSSFYVAQHGWPTKGGHPYGSKAAFSRDWKRSFKHLHHKRARLVDEATGEIVWENCPE